MKKILASIIFLSALVVACMDHEPRLPVPKPESECRNGDMRCYGNIVEVCMFGAFVPTDICPEDGLTCTTDPVSCGFDSSAAGKACCVEP